MKARILTRVLGVLLPTALFLTAPVFAYDVHYRGGHVDHDYSSGGHVNHEYGTGWSRGRDYAYGSYRAPGYTRPPDYGDRYYGGDGHPSGAFGYWGKDARHHYRRGHQHHHGF